MPIKALRGTMGQRKWLPLILILAWDSLAYKCDLLTVEYVSPRSRAPFPGDFGSPKAEEHEDNADFLCEKSEDLEKNNT